MAAARTVHPIAAPIRSRPATTHRSLPVRLRGVGAPLQLLVRGSFPCGDSNASSVMAMKSWVTESAGTPSLKELLRSANATICCNQPLTNAIASTSVLVMWRLATFRRAREEQTPFGRYGMAAAVRRASAHLEPPFAAFSEDRGDRGANYLGPAINVAAVRRPPFSPRIAPLSVYLEFDQVGRGKREAEGMWPA